MGLNCDPLKILVASQTLGKMFRFDNLMYVSKWICIKMNLIQEEIGWVCLISNFQIMELKDIEGDT